MKVTMKHCKQWDYHGIIMGLMVNHEWDIVSLSLSLYIYIHTYHYYSTEGHETALQRIVTLLRLRKAARQSFGAAPVWKNVSEQIFGSMIQ